ncbi:MAG: helix-turn-helix domain-containing protein [Candidatus Omnitrophica bacterium]|nr:helix-turn-helix domain-containing protein [Candidatus Omnitrophota bacterium]
MPEEKLLTVREVAQLLNLTEKEVIEEVEKGNLVAYKVAGVYLRFRRSDIEEFKKEKVKSGKLPPPLKITLKERISDFFYFNDFYIFSFIIILWLVIIILGTQ